MWIEYTGNAFAGPERIRWVKVMDRGKRLEYKDQVFRTLRGRGFKSNYYDTATGEEYWISGCHKDGQDALYSTDAEIDEDALDEYWIGIREQPENKNIRLLRTAGKY
jgi:hypothetical protein